MPDPNPTQRTDEEIEKDVSLSPDVREAARARRIAGAGKKGGGDDKSAAPAKG